MEGYGSVVHRHGTQILYSEPDSPLPPKKILWLRASGRIHRTTLSGLRAYTVQNIIGIETDFHRGVVYMSPVKLNRLETIGD